MNLKNNKGFTGIDVSVAMIIILIFIPTIFGVLYSIQKINGYIERESEAVNIATDIIEIAKSLNYTEVDIENNSSQFNHILENKYLASTYIVDESTGENDKCLLKTGNKNVRYQIQINLQNYYPENIEQEDMKDLVKKLKVMVEYPTSKTTRIINISTVIQNE